MEFTLTPRSVTRFLLSIVCLLALAHLAGVWSALYLGHDHLRGLIYLFSLNEELNIPSFYSGTAILFAAVLVGIIAMAKRKAGERYVGWAFMAGVTLFLAYDELFSVHERLNIPVRGALHTSGVLYFAWVIPYMAGALVVAMLAWKTVMSLPLPIRLRVFASGVIYVLGAAGLEMVGAPRWVADWGVGDPIYQFYSFSEETLEMLGMLMFINAMLMYIEQLKISVRMGAPVPAADVATVKEAWTPLVPRGGVRVATASASRVAPSPRQ